MTKELAINKWRKHTDRTADLIVDVKDIQILHGQRERLTQLLDEFEDYSRAVLEIEPAEDIGLDMIQQETRELKKELNTGIKELR